MTEEIKIAEEEDPRKIGLKKGLKQLTINQLKKLLTYDKDKLVLDTFAYENGKFCPLAVGIGLEKTLDNPTTTITNELVVKDLARRGYIIFNTKGIKGEFYTTNRYEDLMIAVQEVIDERTKK